VESREETMSMLVDGKQSKTKLSYSNPPLFFKFQ